MEIKPAILPHLRLFQQPAEGLGSFRETDLLRLGQHREWEQKVAPE